MTIQKAFFLQNGDRFSNQVKLDMMLQAYELKAWGSEDWGRKSTSSQSAWATWQDSTNPPPQINQVRIQGSNLGEKGEGKI